MRSANYGKKRVFPMLRVKQALTCIGVAFAAPLFCLAGITPQAALGTMFRWMHGYGSEKGQGTAMPVTLASCIGLLAGCIARLSGSHGATLQYHPSLFSRLFAVFMGVTLGAVATVKLAGAMQRVIPRRLLLFAGVMMGVLCVANAGHTADAVSIRIHVFDGLLPLMGVAAIAGAATQITGVASGTFLFPALYFFSQMSGIECSLICCGAVALASLLPMIGYAGKGWIEKSFSGPASFTAMAVCMVAGYRAGMMPDRLSLLLFAFAAMYSAAREMANLPNQTISSAPDL
jgi:hypothetical protein